MPGTSHLATQTPCQDFHAWQLLSRGTLIAAVADGAGTAAHAEVGARIATEVALAVVVERLGDEPVHATSPVAAVLESAIHLARSVVEGEAQALGVPPAALATTLTVVVATGDAVWTAQIGDGAVVAGAVGGELRRVDSPLRTSEYLNETSFLTSSGAVESVQVGSWTGALAHLAILTDGLQALALRLPVGMPHGPFFEPLFDYVRAEPEPERASGRLRSFLCSPRVAARADDDMTLLLAVRL